MQAGHHLIRPEDVQRLTANDRAILSTVLFIISAVPVGVFIVLFSGNRPRPRLSLLAVYHPGALPRAHALPRRSPLTLSLPTRAFYAAMSPLTGGAEINFDPREGDDDMIDKRLKDNMETGNLKVIRDYGDPASDKQTAENKLFVYQFYFNSFL